jgi:YVTN family beta-propeller protein
MKSRFWKTLCALFVCQVVVGSVPAAPASAGEYLGPQDVAASPDGKSLFVLSADAAQVAVVDPAAGKVVRTIGLPPGPTGLAISPDGGKLYVTCAAPLGTLLAIDAASGKVLATIAAGHGATAPAITPDGKRAYVCNRFDNDVSVIELSGDAGGKEIGRVGVIREPAGSAVTPDGKLVLVTNLMPNDPADGYDVACEVSVIDAAGAEVTNVRLPNGSSSLRGICVSPDGKYAYAVHILARYQMPTTQLERGWMNTNAMSVIDVTARKLVNTVLLDDIDLGAANPWDVATTADGRQICVTLAGTHELCVIDAQGLLEKLHGMPATVEEAKQQGRYDDRGTYSSVTVDDVPNDLAFLVGLKRRVRLHGRSPWAIPSEDDPVIKGPRGVAVVGDKAYVAVYFSDLLSVVDLTKTAGKLVSEIPLGPRPEMTAQRRGEMFFHDADLCFQHWQSCSSCHPDARADGLNWDLMNDDMGNPKNAKSMLLVDKTPPAMASGVRSGMAEAVRSGITHIQFAVRPEEDALAIDEYLKALTPVPSPHLVDGKLSQSAARGKELFFSDRLECGKCHPAPLYADLQMHDVESRGRYDRRSDFDTPTLVECWRTAPYMHDGRYTTMKQIFLEGRHGEAGGGDIQGLSEQELNDLVEFVLSL